MPKLNEKEIISPSTERTFRILMTLSSVNIITKIYEVELSSTNIFNHEFSGGLIDAAFIIALCFYFYSHALNWAGDVASFRLWYQSNQLWSEFGTRIDVNTQFINGGEKFLTEIYKHKNSNLRPLIDGEDWLKHDKDFQEFIPNYILDVPR